MTLTQKLLGGASLAVALASVSIAQQASVTTTAASLFGVKYIEAGAGYLDLNHVDRGVYAAGVGVNLPVSGNVDVGVNYSHDWLENNDSVYTNTVGASATGYLTEGSLRPFATAGIGYVWEGSGDDDYGIWDLAGGVEYSFNSTTALRASAGYGDTFESGDDGTYFAKVGVSHWFTSTIAGTAGVTFIEGGDVGYGVSVVFKF